MNLVNVETFQRFVFQADIRTYNDPPVINVVCLDCEPGPDGLPLVVQSFHTAKGMGTLTRLLRHVAEHHSTPATTVPLRAV